MNELVSIITPAYNSANYISDCINSVLNQTYQYWELIIIDDKSSDNTAEIVNIFSKVDDRIYFESLENNSGSATVPRNKGLNIAKGKYIAFLDSDDLWCPTKLEEQIRLFKLDYRIAIVFSNYEKISEYGVRNKRIIVAPAIVNYNKLLYGNSIACLTAIYDSSLVGKVYFKDVGHEDFVVWLTILKPGFIAKNTNTMLAYYRVRNNSLSSNKINTVIWIWNIYKNIEKINLLKSIYYFVCTMIKSTIKYFK